jgi:hypothetical protein
MTLSDIGTCFVFLRGNAYVSHCVNCKIYIFEPEVSTS